MPLQKLQFRPGTNRESTNYGNEGGWYQTNKVRFRSGLPEKIGGWTKDAGALATTIAGVETKILTPSTGTLWGIARSLWNWVTLNGYNLVSVGTNQKFYIQNGNGGSFYDVTPLRETTAAGGATFAATTGSSTIVVTDSGYGGQTGDFVTFSGAVGLGGNVTAAILNAEFQITYISSSTYSITVSVVATAGDSGNGGASVVAAYQITTGGDVYTVGVGWGAGGWSGTTTGYTSTGWGAAAPAGLGIGIQLRLWSESNYGEDLVFNPRGGPIYYWVVDATPSIFNRAQVISASNTNTQNGIAYWDADATCPTACNFVLVSDSSRFTIAFGTNDPTGVYATTALDPMQVRWSDQENLLVWTPAITNQAGDYRLSHGSTIITAQQTRQEILVFTDSAIYSMQYLGPPYVWSFQILGDNISIAGPNVVASASNITYWMGLDKFYMYSGRVETLPSTLREYVFTDINISQAFQFVSGTNEGYNEVWWQYCSANSNVIDRYVIYNYLDNVWYYGDWTNYTGTAYQGRTAWLDSALRQYPMAATYGAASTSLLTNSNAILVYHESGVDDATVNPAVPIVANVQSSDFDIGEGNNFGFVWRLIPDLTFDGSNVNQPTAYFTAIPRTFPGAAYGPSNNPGVTSTQNYQNQITYNIQQFTQQVYVRIRGRQMAFKVSSGTAGSATDGLGVQWQLGAPRIDIRPDGRR
jgi:hypothetical protein